MPCTLTWIDHDLTARDRALRILSLFQEKESRDELGLGAISGGLLTFWKISAQGKDGQISHHIVRIGISVEGDRAPWLERLDEKLLSMQVPTAITPEEWKQLAVSNKLRIQELLHRELSYSGIINEEVSYSATPLAIIGIEN